MKVDLRETIEGQSTGDLTFLTLLCAGTRVLPDDTNNNKISHLLRQGATATIHQLPPDNRLRRIADSNESP